jgi:CheY-like chemotaxis protein
VLFELVTGRTPFHRSLPIATLAAIQSADPEPTGALCSEPGLWDILRWGLVKDRSERWSSARELGQALAWWAIARGIEADVAGTSLTSHWGTCGSGPRRAPEQPQAPRGSGQPRSATRSPTILLADDDGAHRAALRYVLREEGYEVIEASDGDEVLAILKSSPLVPDLLLLDFCMPGFSGLGVLRLLKRLGEIPPTIIMTSFPDSSVDRMAQQLGALEVLHKPLDLERLRADVAAALASR